MRRHYKAKAAIQRTRGRGFSREFFIRANKELAAKAPPTKEQRAMSALVTQLPKSTNLDLKIMNRL